MGNTGMRISGADRAVPNLPGRQKDTKMGEKQRGLPEDRISLQDPGDSYFRVEGNDKLWEQLIDRMQERYPGISIVEAEAADMKDMLEKTADQMGDGCYLILSDGFMKSMEASEENYERKTKALIQMLHRLSKENVQGLSGAWLEEGKAVFWQVERPDKDAQNMQRQIEQVKQMFPGTGTEETKYTGSSLARNENLRLHVSPSAFRVSSVYARVAHARSQGGVRNALQEVQRNLGSLRLVSAFGNDEERLKARKAIQSLQKLLMRGNAKIKQIAKEELLQKKERRALEERRQEEAKQLAMELKERRKSRKIKDQVLLNEGRAEENKWKQYHAYDPQSVPVLPPPPAMPAITGMQGMAGTVEVTEVVEF